MFVLCIYIVAVYRGEINDIRFMVARGRSSDISVIQKGNL